ncbi:hypothetical protein FACS1894122_00940 [Alphaproteobacteria bacterium]|nr:hypothetical protein FACS1894122_00940 [Alphaproteobacteria bacterium]
MDQYVKLMCAGLLGSMACGDSMALKIDTLQNIYNNVRVQDGGAAIIFERVFQAFTSAYAFRQEYVFSKKPEKAYEKLEGDAANVLGRLLMNFDGFIRENGNERVDEYKNFAATVAGIAREKLKAIFDAGNRLIRDSEIKEIARAANYTFYAHVLRSQLGENHTAALRYLSLGFKENTNLRITFKALLEQIAVVSTPESAPEPAPIVSAEIWPIELVDENVPYDGDCGFHALDLDRKRAQKPGSPTSQSRTVIIGDIENALDKGSDAEKKAIVELIAPEIFTRYRSPEGYDQADMMPAMLDDKTKEPLLLPEFFDVDHVPPHVLLKFCQNEKIIRSYLKFMRQNKFSTWLETQSDSSYPYSTGIIDAVAHIRGKNLVVVDFYDRTLIHARPFPGAKPEDTIYILKEPRHYRKAKPVGSSSPASTGSSSSSSAPDISQLPPPPPPPATGISQLPPAPPPPPSLSDEDLAIVDQFSVYGVDKDVTKSKLEQIKSRIRDGFDPQEIADAIIFGQI